MSYLIAPPDIMTSAATDLATIGSVLTAARAAAGTSTTGMLAAAEDEVSAAIFFQALGAQAAPYDTKLGRVRFARTPLQIRRVLRSAERTKLCQTAPSRAYVHPNHVDN
jgi:hypothetical protein